MIWNSLEEFFDCINNNTEYVILRNWGGVFPENLLNGKDDMDILCSNREEFIRITGARPLFHYYGICNYYINIKAYKVRLDIRWVGDGYYCREWEERLLKGRIFDEKGFYILNFEDHFFSLLYHALIQKPRLSIVYYERLNALAENEKTLQDVAEFLHILREYMNRNHYYVEYPSDCAVFFNRGNIHLGKLAIKRSLKKKFLRISYRIHNRMKRLYTQIIH